ncbi:MAG TPA: glycosyltransferase family 39 protein, partial [Planctomycetota bacterium]|nr:glycosyltransferase family 39 protein [Planctomycetota bacterium]
MRTTLFLLLVAILELGYGLYNPPLHNPDELSHLQNAAWWRDEGTWADPYSEAERIQQDHHPPYTGILGGIVLKLTEGVFEDSAPLRLPGPYEVTLDFGREERVRAADDKAKARIGQLYVLRFVIALHQLLLAFFLLRCLDFVWPDRRRFAFGIALACCAIPQVAMNGAALTPDTPLAAFSTAALYYVLRAASGQGSARRLGLAAGCFFALALWCKSGAIFLIPTTCVAALVRASALRSLRAGLTWLLWCALPPLVFGSYWYVRNLYLHGDPFHMHVLVETYTFAMRREPATAAFVEVTFWDIFRTFFGYWNRAILLPRPLILALAGACGAAALGVLLLLRRSVRSELPREALNALAPSFVALATLLALTVMGNFVFPSAQGRYLYPALAGFAVLFGSGLRIALRLRGDSRLVYLGVAVWIGIGYLGFDYAVLSKFYASRARAQGEGAVVFYEDCGAEGLHPLLVPGTGLTPPDEGMLGRVVPWRTISAHPVAVVYRFDVPRDVDVNDLQVRLTYYNPDPSTPFVAHERGHFVYPTQRLRANGILLHDEVEITSQPKELVYPLPRSVFAGTRADGARAEPATEPSRSLELRFEKTAGIAACVAEIWVERRWVGASSEATSPMLHNRTQRQLEVVVLQG